MIKFYDTSSLLLAGEDILSEEEFRISSITIQELENIKTSSFRDQETKYAARQALNMIEQCQNKCTIVHHSPCREKDITSQSLEVTNDTKILSDVLAYDPAQVVFVTNDLALKHLAQSFFQLKVESYRPREEDYTGFFDVRCSPEEQEQFYNNESSEDHNKRNTFALYKNQYLILRNETGEIIDLLKWDGEEHKYLNAKPFKSKWFGTIAPKDIYQKMAFDSLRNNQLTMLKGPPGSGKSIVAISYLMNRLESHNIDKIVIFCNPVATINSAKLGFYPGDKNSKLIDSQIGNFLCSKLGGRTGVEQLINSEKLLLLPFADLRGYDTTGMNAGIYVTEAQNLDKTLIKLALQRIGEDCICILDGDNETQVDLRAYDGTQNGMKRVSEIFRGQDIYGEVKLQTIFRSKIADIANKI